MSRCRRFLSAWCRRLLPIPLIPAAFANPVFIDVDRDGTRDFEIRAVAWSETSAAPLGAPGRNTTSTFSLRIISRPGCAIWVDAQTGSPLLPAGTPVPPSADGTWSPDTVEIQRTVHRRVWEWTQVGFGTPPAWIWSENFYRDIPLPFPSAGSHVAVRIGSGPTERIGWAEILPTVEWIGAVVLDPGVVGRAGQYAVDPPPSLVHEAYGPDPVQAVGPPWRYDPSPIRRIHPAPLDADRVTFVLDPLDRGMISWWVADLEAATGNLHYHLLPGTPVGSPVTLGDRAYQAVREGATNHHLISRDLRTGGLRTEFTHPASLPSAPGLGPVWAGRDGDIYGVIHPAYRTNRLFRWRPGDAAPEILGPIPEIPLQGLVPHRTGTDGAHYAVGRLPVAGNRSGLLRLPPDGGPHEVVESWEGDSLPLVAGDADSLVFIRTRGAADAIQTEELVRFEPGLGTRVLWQSEPGPGHRIVRLAGSATAGVWAIRAESVPADSTRRHLARFDPDAGTWVPVGAERSRNFRELALAGQTAVAFEHEGSMLWSASADGRLRPLRPFWFAPLGPPPLVAPSTGPDGWVHGTIPPPATNGMGRFYSLDPVSGLQRQGPSTPTLAPLGQVPSHNVVIDDAGRTVGALWDRQTRTVNVLSFAPDGSDLRREHPVPIPMPGNREPDLELLAADASRIWLSARTPGAPEWLRVFAVNRDDGHVDTVWSGDGAVRAGAGVSWVPGRGLLAVISEPVGQPAIFELRAEWVPDGRGPAIASVLATPGSGDTGGLVRGARLTSPPASLPAGRVFVGIEAGAAVDAGGAPLPGGTALAEIEVDPVTGRARLRHRLATARLVNLSTRNAVSLLATDAAGQVQVVYPDQAHSLPIAGADGTVRPVAAMGADVLQVLESSPTFGQLIVHPGPVEAPAILAQPVTFRRSEARDFAKLDLTNIFRMPDRAPIPRFIASGLPPGLTLSESNSVEGLIRRDGEFDVELVAEAFGDPSWRTTNRFRWTVVKKPVRIRAGPHDAVVGNLDFVPALVQEGGPPLSLGYRLTAGPESPAGTYEIIPFPTGSAADLEGLDIQIVPGVLRLFPDGIRIEPARMPDGRMFLWARHPAGPVRRVRIESSGDAVHGPWMLQAEGTTAADRAVEWLLPRPTGTGNRFFRIQVFEAGP